tara:strand:+ start:69 stop:431 length:363 start_codon:yes stop_codon:yes gene_type:complete
MKTNKLKWKKLSRERYYAVSPVNNFVFLSVKYPVGWSNQIIFKKHLDKAIKEYGCIDTLDVEDLQETEFGHTLIDCLGHTLGCSKAEFQRYVDNYSTHKKHSFDFFKLKEYINNNTNNND